MRYLLDSDVARKLAQYDLLNELSISLRCTLSDFCVLPQLKYQMHVKDRAKAVKKLKSEFAFDALTALLSHASEVVILQSAETDAIFALDVPSLDSGELTLLAALISNPNDKLTTGDKRALAALSSIDGIPTLPESWLRIICLEEALLMIVQSQNFSAISAKVRAAPYADTSIRNVFGNSAPAPLGQVIEGLQSELQAVVRQTNGRYTWRQAPQ